MGGTMPNDRWVQLAADLLKEHNTDNRLSPGQMHMLCVSALSGREPLELACELVDKSLDPKSKVQISEVEAAKILIQVSDRIYEMETRTRRAPAASDQFELSFAWADKQAEVTQ